MSVGIWFGGSVVWGEGYKRSVSDVFLIENPSKVELNIKEKLIKCLEDQEKSKAEKAAIKCIPLSKMEVGGIYKDLSNSEYLYLGKCEQITYKQKYSSYEEKDKISGYCFAYVYQSDKELNINNVINRELEGSYRNGIPRSLGFLKGNKKFKEKVGQVQLENKYEHEWERGFYRSSTDKYKTVLTLNV